MKVAETMDIKNWIKNFDSAIFIFFHSKLNENIYPVEIISKSKTVPLNEMQIVWEEINILIKNVFGAGIFIC